MNYNRELEQKWCPGPARVGNHLLPCTLLDGHKDDCIPPRNWRIDHSCIFNQCPR